MTETYITSVLKGVSQLYKRSLSPLFVHPLVCITATALLINSSNAQAPDSAHYGAFTDFHIHTSFKNYYRHIPHPDSAISQTGTGNDRYNKTNWIPFRERKKINDQEKSLT